MIRSGFSFKVAAGHLADVVSRLKEIGWTTYPICDRNSTFAFVKATKLCKKEGLRPVYGVELGVAAEKVDAKTRKPILDYWRFLAVDELRAVHDLVDLATANPGKEPYLTYDQVADAHGVYKIAGPHVLLDRVCLDDFYVGLSPALPKFTYLLAKKRGLQFIATSDNYYPRIGDREFYRVLIGKNSLSQVYPQHVLSDDEWAAWMSRFASAEDMASAIANRDTVLAVCGAEMKRATMIVAEKPKTLEAMCRDGAAALGCDLTNEEYDARLRRELDMIEEKNFADYFYVLADVINWAKQRMIVGPARGSSCGSLVCYLLGITTVDPIPYGLLFDRFIDTTRSDLPDVDVDFSDVRRHMVFEYMEKKFGKDRVARLGSVGQYKARSALNQVGVALRIPPWTVARVADGAIKRSGGDSRAASTIEDTLLETDAGREMLREFPEARIVFKMEDHPANAGQHAAGVVVTQEPIAEFVAVNYKTGGAMCDKKDAEELNLLKIDALGLTQLSVFERTLELIGKPSINGYLETIPLDDPAAFEVLNRGHFAGVFQFTGATVASLTKEIVVDSLEDIVAITALARPGPIGSGGADQWVKRRNGVDKVTYHHELFRKYVEESYGIVLYQEQVMKIGREIGDLSWEDVNALRRAMSKSLGKEFFAKYGEAWKAGAVSKGIPASILDGVWDDLCNYGAMSFNRAHSVAYGLVSYWCCWLKAHHPLEFAAATLDMEPDPYRQIRILKELAAEGVEYTAVDPERSTDKWTPVTIGNSRRLVGPLINIAGVGPVAVREILKARAEGKELRAGLAKKLTDPKTPIDSLTPIADAIKRLHPDLVKSEVLLPSTRPIAIKDLARRQPGRVVVLGLMTQLNPSDDNSLVKVAKRGGKRVPEPSMALTLWLQDDSDEVLCRVHRLDFERLAKPIMERGEPGKSLYAVMGEVPPIDFRMIKISAVKYLGRIDGDGERMVSELEDAAKNRAVATAEEG